MKEFFLRKSLVFPYIIIVLFLVAVAFAINGSSVGSYDNVFYGTPKTDKHLVLGTPQPVRSDEWLVITPMTASQHFNNYHSTNTDVGFGQDMTVILDAPVKDWTTVLRPWNWAFFILPFENAFAFKWWFMLVAFGLAVYALALRLFPRKYLLASGIAVFAMLSPFVQWWYREYTAGLLAFGMGSLATMLCIHKATSLKAKLILSGLLAYLLAGFIFIQYPPFEILVALAVALFYVGFVANLFFAPRKAKEKAKAQKIILRDVGFVISAAVVAIIVIAIFYLQHHGALEALRHTTFPGKRSYPSGQGTTSTLAHFYASDIMPFLQRHVPALQSYFGNQSEASLFIQYSLVLLIPTGAILFKNFKAKQPTNWLLITLPVGMLLIYTYLFVPGLQTIFKPLMFNTIPINRFEMGLGILDLLLLLVLAKDFPVAFKVKRTQYIIAGLTVFVTLVVFLLADFYTRSHYPGLVSGKLMIASAIWMAAALGLILINKKEIGFSLLIILSLASVFRVNPFYQGLDPLINTPLAKYIQSTAHKDPSARWATTYLLLESYPQANGAKSITGDYSYPQKDFWKLFDTGKSDYAAYNRAVHVNAVIDTKNDISLPLVNRMEAHINPCSNLMRQLNIKYLLTISPQNNKCLVLEKSFPTANGSALVYKIKPGS